MAIRNFVLSGCCLMLIGCGPTVAKPPTEAELKVMNEKMQQDMMSMQAKLPKKLGEDQNPMNNMKNIMNPGAAPKK